MNIPFIQTYNLVAQRQHIRLKIRVARQGNLNQVRPIVQPVPDNSDRETSSASHPTGPGENNLGCQLDFHAKQPTSARPAALLGPAAEAAVGMDLRVKLLGRTTSLVIERKGRV